MTDRHSRREWILRAGRAGALLAGLGGVVWASGLPFLFPSLGPTAYLFATNADPSTAANAVAVGDGD